MCSELSATQSSGRGNAATPIVQQQHQQQQQHQTSAIAAFLCQRCRQHLFLLFAANVMLLLCAGLSQMPVQGGWCLAEMTAVYTIGSLAVILPWMTVQRYCGSIAEKSTL